MKWQVRCSVIDAALAWNQRDYPTLTMALGRIADFNQAWLNLQCGFELSPPPRALRDAIWDAELSHFLDGSGSKKSPDMRTIFGSDLVRIANVNATSTSAPAPAPDLSEICQLRLRLRIPGLIIWSPNYLHHSVNAVTFVLIPHISFLDCILDCTFKPLGFTRITR